MFRRWLENRAYTPPFNSQSSAFPHKADAFIDEWRWEVEVTYFNEFHMTDERMKKHRKLSVPMRSSCYRNWTQDAKKWSGTLRINDVIDQKFSKTMLCVIHGKKGSNKCIIFSKESRACNVQHWRIDPTAVSQTADITYCVITQTMCKTDQFRL